MIVCLTAMPSRTTRTGPSLIAKSLGSIKYMTADGSDVNPSGTCSVSRLKYTILV